MKKFKILLTLILIIFLSGCFGNSSMVDIEIKTTAYPIEYVTERLYGEYSNITSLYPNGMDPGYVVSDKLLNDYSSANLFIFNSSENNENDYMYKMSKKNKGLKIINATRGLPNTYGMEELWLDPINLLTIANNIKKGFEEYTNTAYVLEHINSEYDKLKVELIQLNADYDEMAERANNKTIIVGSDLFLYLKKYGLDVISLEDNENLTKKTIHDATDLVKNKQIKTIYIPKGTEANSYINDLKKNYGVDVVELDTLYTLTEQDRKDNKDYMSIMYNNLELLKLQLYN